MRKYIALFLSFVFLLVVTTAWGLLKKSSSSVDISQSEIIKNIQKNNPIQVFGQGSEDLTKPNFNYSYLKTSTIRGPEYENCPYMIFRNEYPISESSKYEDKSQNISYTKFVNYNEQGVMVDTLINTPREIYHYKGGQYATKRTNNFDNPAPQSLDPIAGYTIDEIKVSISEVSNGNVPMYKLEFLESLNCDLILLDESTFDNNNPASEIKVILYVNKSTFEIDSLEAYKGLVSPQTMIYTKKFIQEVENKDSTIITTQFQLDPSIEVKEIAAPQNNSEEERKTTSFNYMKTNAIKLLIPNTELEIRQINATFNSNIDHEKNRDFYPEGPVGDSLYDKLKIIGGDAVETTQEALVSYMDFDLGVYSNVYSDNSIISHATFLSTGGAEQITKLNSTPIIVNNKSYNAEIYEVSSKFQTNTTFKIMVLSIDEFKYTFYGRLGTLDELPTESTFTIYDMSIDNNINRIQSML